MDHLDLDHCWDVPAAPVRKEMPVSVESWAREENEETPDRKESAVSKAAKVTGVRRVI